MSEIICNANKLLIFNISFQVSNMVMQLLHSIKYSVEVPFSNIAQQPSEITKMNSTKKVREWVESESEPVFFTYSVSYSIYLLLPKLLLLIHKILFQSIIFYFLYKAERIWHPIGSGDDTNIFFHFSYFLVISKLLT